MKRFSLLATVALLAALVLAPRVTFAQDPVKIAPEMYKLNWENDRVRVLDLTVPPGAKIPKHSHPDHFAYVLTPGKLRIMKDGAEPMEAEVTAGQVLWIAAETHWAENIGETELRIVVTELKEPAPKKKAAPKKKST